MRKVPYIATVAVMACGLATQAAWGASPPTGHALSAYLAKIKPLNGAVVAAEASWIKAKAHPNKGSNNTDPALNKKELIATLQQTAGKLKRIVPPAALKSAHAALVSSLKLEAQGANGRANPLRTRWRLAVTQRLRRARLPVPRWVQKVRDPLA